MKYRVQLPKTNFPMKADLPLREPGFLSLWEKNDIYHRALERNRRAGGASFILHDGPPYANGHLHMGHALNKILKDITVKHKASLGFVSPYVPGWDCHGLPIEHQLMKEKGWDKRKVARVTFREEAARYAEHFIGVQRQEFKRLGVMGEWDKPYKTMAPSFEAGIVKTFYDLFGKGFIYRDKKPVYWCGICETALADAEVEYEDKKSPSIYVKFPLVEWPSNEEAQAAAKAAGKQKVFVLAWTTTPWTLPANVALAFHPEQKYRLWQSPKSPDKYLVGDPGWKVLEETLGPGNPNPVTVSGLALEGVLCKSPVSNNDSVGVLAEFVSTEEGTGVVHIAPGHGLEDYAVGREYGLPILSPVDDAARYTTDVRPNSLTGQNIWEANKEIIALLEKSRLLLARKEISHSYPHCWRSKNPVFFRATEQWFLRVSDAFRQELLRQTDRVRWVPAYGKDRMTGMLKTRPDWTLSRQRYWGTPIPMLTCDKCREPLEDQAVFTRVIDAFREHGSNIWFEKDAAHFAPGAKCKKCGNAGFKKEEDILDVWFDSGVSWVPVLRERLHVNTRENVLYLEGSDQHRGWFQTSLLPGVALTGEPPYAEVLTHGFVVDGEGRKMSKSLGNVIAPQDVQEKFGADVLRLWVAVSDYREDVRLSPQILDHVVDTYRKIRNTLRFLLGNLADFKPELAVPFEKLEPLDLAVLHHLNGVAARVKKHYEAYSFHLVSTEICDLFCIGVLSGYYLDVQKDVLYCDPAEAPRRRSAQTAFLHVAKSLARFLAPVLSFTAEETWQTLREQNLLSGADEPESVFLNSFPAPLELPKAPVSMETLLSLKRAVNERVEALRQKGDLKGANDAFLRLAPPAGEARSAGFSPERWAAYMGVAKAALEESANGSGPVKELARAPGKKCDRCWIWKEDVGADAEFPAVCGRCAAAEKAQGPAA